MNSIERQKNENPPKTESPKILRKKYAKKKQKNDFKHNYLYLIEYVFFFSALSSAFKTINNNASCGPDYRLLADELSIFWTLFDDAVTLDMRKGEAW